MAATSKAPEQTWPERLLRDLTTKHPGMWSDLARHRAEHGAEWPGWCYCPITHVMDWLVRDWRRHHGPEPLDDIAIAPALAGWRMGRGIYTFDEALARALIATPLDGHLPVELLFQLPEWCVYVEAPPNLSPHVSGFLAFLDYDIPTGRAELRLVIDDPGASWPVPVPMHLIAAAGIRDALAAALQYARDADAAFGKPDEAPLDLPTPEHYACYNLAGCINLLLYLCNVEADYQGGSRPRNPEPVKTRRGPKLFAAESPRVWRIGATIGERLRQAHGQAEPRRTPEERNAPRPHLRRAHWHTYRVGEGRQNIRVRWLHPILVGYGGE